MNYPQYTPSNRTAREGFNILTEIVERELGWIVRPNHKENDFGIDAYLDITMHEFVTGKSIAVQIKSGDSYFKECDKDFWTFTGEKKHLNYYLNHDIPVVIILVDTHSKTAYWEVCKVEYINFISDTSWALPIPKRQQINNTQKEKLMRYVSKNIDYVSHYESYWQGNEILSDRDYICIIVEEDDIKRKNYKHLAELINRISSNKMLLSRYKEHIDIGIQGYDDDTRELCEIEEVRDWIMDVFAHVPGLSYFLVNSGKPHFLKNFFLSNIQGSITTAARNGGRFFIHYTPEEIEKILTILFSDLNYFTRRFDIGEDVNSKITRNIVECLIGKRL